VSGRVGRVEVRLGDCRDVLRELPDGAATAVVTDPPYGLGFMGHGWDRGVPGPDVWREVARVLRPGGHALVFGGTRTFHRLACALEDAGLEIRDCLAWLYGQGFPKSLDLARAIDRLRFRRAEVLEVTAWVRGALEASGRTRAELDEVFGFRGMAGHWTSSASQPSVPTLEQVPTLLAFLGVEELPGRIRELLLELNGRRGEPGRDWFRREKIGERVMVDATKRPLPFSGPDAPRRLVEITAPHGEDARRWEGYGTALKPAWEPILLVRRPPGDVVARCALEHGTGGLNVAGCRIEAGADYHELEVTQGGSPAHTFGERERRDTFVPGDGRWPANVVLDEESAAELDRRVPRAGAQAGHRGGGAPRPGRGVLGPMSPAPARTPHDLPAGASRFFYCAKASDRDVLPAEDLPLFGEAHGAVRNDHPTVKPVELMRWLVRLVRVPGENLVVDPFAGSGSTGVAAVLEDVPALLVELEASHVELALRRLRRAVM